jgi:CheY-like chemotaxis protein
VRARLAAEHAQHELESFSYSVAHDLRAPLRSIDGFSQALLEDHSDKLDANGQRYLRHVRESAQLMAELIDDILALSRVTRHELRREDVSLSREATDVLSRLAARDPGRVVHWRVAPEIVVRADRKLLLILLENLLSNAWKFTAKRAVAHIEVGVEHGPEPVYYVRDDGAGFDMTYANKLFESSRACTRPRSSRGRVSVWRPCSASCSDTKDASGARVASTTVLVSDSRSGTKTGAPPHRRRPSRPRKEDSMSDADEGVILLVEDNPRDEELTLRAFKRSGIANEVQVVRDGAEALDRLLGRGAHTGAALPELVLLDLKLPKVDGLEVLRALRQDPRTALLPIVVLTSSVEEQDLVRSYQLGANSYDRKPVDFNQFADAVRQLGLYWMVLNRAAPRGGA